MILHIGCIFSSFCIFFLHIKHIIWDAYFAYYFTYYFAYYFAYCMHIVYIILHIACIFCAYYFVYFAYFHTYILCIFGILLYAYCAYCAYSQGKMSGSGFSLFITTIAWSPIPGPTYHHLQPSPLLADLSQLALGKSADSCRMAKGIVPVAPTGTRGRRPSIQETGIT